VAAPQLSVTTFRLRREPAEPLPHWNQRNQSFKEAINASGEVFLSSTMLPTAEGTEYCLRACQLSFRTHAVDVERCLHHLAQYLNATF
jgi:hypothetical protein